MKNYPFIQDIPAAEYHAAAARGEFLSSHNLALFRACPAAYRLKMEGAEIQPETPALLVGRAVHALTLEGRSAFDAEFLVSDGPRNPKTGEPFGRLTKAYQEWAAAQDRAVVSTKDFGWMVAMQRAVWLHGAAAELLGSGFAEGTIRVRLHDEPCQTRMDWFNPDAGIVDLKTCDTIEYFESDARRYGYIHQLSFYREAFREVSGKTVEAHLIAVEKHEPYRVGVWTILPASLDEAEEQNAAAIAELHECRRTDTWPTRFEEPRILALH